MNKNQNKKSSNTRTNSKCHNSSKVQKNSGAKCNNK